MGELYQSTDTSRFTLTIKTNTVALNRTELQVRNEASTEDQGCDIVLAGHV